MARSESLVIIVSTALTDCSLPDRATRVFLLDNLDKMIDHLSKRVVTIKSFQTWYDLVK